LVVFSDEYILSFDISVNNFKFFKGFKSMKALAYNIPDPLNKKIIKNKTNKLY
jgi:hypothetical protein